MKKIVVILLSFLFSVSLFAQPRIVSHRGGRFEVEENTLEAFSSALEFGLTGFELDIHTTADGKYVIMHDFEVKRMTGTEGTIEKMTFDELRKLRTLKGHRIPSLEEVVALFAKYDGLYVEFELKTTKKDLYPREVLVKYLEDVYSMVQPSKRPNSTYIFSSFDTRPLAYLTERHPEAKVMYITSEGMSDKTRAIAATCGTNRIACHRAKTTFAEMQQAHKEGFIVNLWPNGTMEEFMLSYFLGADLICTDIPRQALEKRKNYLPL